MVLCSCHSKKTKTVDLLKLVRHFPIGLYMKTGKTDTLEANFPVVQTF